MILPVRTTPEAEVQIREIDTWWRTNRPASPALLADELAAAFDLVGRVPHIGRLYRRAPILGTRRLLLQRTRYHLYYVPRADEVRILAVWHAQRGVGPPLRV